MPPEHETCKFCGNTLYYNGINVKGDMFIWFEPIRCSCEKAINYWIKSDKKVQDEKERVETEKQNQLFNDKINRLIGSSGIKKRFETRTFDNFKTNLENIEPFKIAKHYAENFTDIKETGRGLYIEGTYGAGKTHLAVSIALFVINKNIPVICKTAIDILGDIRKSYDLTDLTEAQILDVYKNVDLLVIDDLGKEKCTDWSVSTLYQIINDRYEQLKPTIITTNYNESMLIDRQTVNGDDSTIRAIVSRLHECTDVVTMTCLDYRKG